MHPIPSPVPHPTSFHSIVPCPMSTTSPTWATSSAASSLPTYMPDTVACGATTPFSYVERMNMVQQQKQRHSRRGCRVRRYVINIMRCMLRCTSGLILRLTSSDAHPHGFRQRLHRWGGGVGVGVEGVAHGGGCVWRGLCGVVFNGGCVVLMECVVMCTHQCTYKIYSCMCVYVYMHTFA